jgi:hypothetical protein
MGPIPAIKTSKPHAPSTLNNTPLSSRRCVPRREGRQRTTLSGCGAARTHSLTTQTTFRFPPAPAFPMIGAAAHHVGGGVVVEQLAALVQTRVVHQLVVHVKLRRAYTHGRTHAHAGACTTSSVSTYRRVRQIFVASHKHARTHARTHACTRSSCPRTAALSLAPH